MVQFSIAARKPILPARRRLAAPLLLVVIAAAGLGAVSPALAVDSAPPPIASYSIEASLDPALHQVRGRQTIRWRNGSLLPANELCLHLYLNAFRSSTSTWLREADPGEIDTLATEGWGWIDLSRLEIAGTDLLAALRYDGWEGGNPEDRTVARLPLPSPVAPGESVEIEVDFLSQLPRVVARTGFKNDFHLVAQWFPKLGRLRSDGRWHCHPFHYASEFFADFGTYDVSLTVPDRFVVGATGERIEERAGDDGTRTVRYRQEAVHDFAWTAWPRFVEARRAFRDPELPPVELILLLRPETRRYADRYFTALEHALRLFGRWYGPYPYRTLTVVDPPWGAEQAGGMEYPTFITTGTDLHSPPATLEPEGLVIHEFGHQYFYGLIASDEQTESYLDEGLTTYATGRVLRAAYPALAWSYDFWGWERTWPGIHRRQTVDTSARFFRRPTVDPIARVSWGYLDPGAYGSLTYSKMALFMEQIERTVGEAPMERAISAYAQRFRFAHPRTADLERTLSRETGIDLTPWFRQLVQGAGRLDYAVTRAVSHRRAEPAGASFAEGEGSGEGEGAGEGVPGGESSDRPVFESVVEVRRLGEVRLPVTVELSFADGRRERRVWDGEERWVRYRVRGPRLVAAEVDPDAVMVLDADRLNNSRRTRADRRASRRWHQRVRFWIQNLLETAAALA